MRPRALARPAASLGQPDSPAGPHHAAAGCGQRGAALQSPAALASTAAAERGVASSLLTGGSSPSSSSGSGGVSLGSSSGRERQLRVAVDVDEGGPTGSGNRRLAPSAAGRALRRPANRCRAPFFKSGTPQHFPVESVARPGSGISGSSRPGALAGGAGSWHALSVANGRAAPSPPDTARPPPPLTNPSASPPGSLSKSTLWRNRLVPVPTHASAATALPCPQCWAASCTPSTSFALRCVWVWVCVCGGGGGGAMHVLRS